MYTPSPSSDLESESNAMKLFYFSNEFPRDDLQDLFRKLSLHRRSREHPLLALFIAEATVAVREEIRQLPTELKQFFPPFESVLEWAAFAELRQSRLSGSIDGVILCVLEIGTLIGHFENNPQAFDAAAVTTALSGLGIGLLATAALSLAPTVADLVSTGTEVIRQAFRLGITVDEVSHDLESPDTTEPNTRDPWAYTLPDVSEEDVQTELDLIHEQGKTSETCKVFISAVSQTSVTISGPPARLKTMIRTSTFFHHHKPIALPVFAGLCHAGHIYSEAHAQHIVRTKSMGKVDARFRPRIPIYSTSTGKPFPAHDATGLFESIILEILTKTIRLLKVTAGVYQLATDLRALECEVIVFRKSLPIHDLTAALEKAQDLAVTTQEIVPWILDTNVAANSTSKIAIVGMACRMPGGATDTGKLWTLLEDGLDIHRKIPADRFDVDTHYDPTKTRVNASHTSYGCFIDEPGLFDAQFFNMSPREAQQTDPMQRLALVTAYEALERAGYVANRTTATDLHRIGTFYGQASDDYREVNTAQEISTYFIPGGCRAFGPGRINYFFKFSGPSYSIDTACSSSLATIQLACAALWSADVDTAVAGGMNVLTNSDAFAGLSNGHFLSETPNACKTWDSTADGYCRADAIGSVVMKRLDDAERDNDNILGVILGAATNHSAEAVSITHPHAGHQGYLGELVARKAGVNPLDISYVEMHGTGTQAGDTEEIQSVMNTYAPGRRRSAKNPLHIGAVKSNVGHSEAAAGVTALLKVLLMLQNGAIPPHVGIKTALNPNFTDLEQRGVRIPYSKVAWPSDPKKKRIAVINNFSAAGGNSTLLLEEAPVRAMTATDPRRTHVIALSAKSKASLRKNIERMSDYVKSSDVLLPDLSYSTTARRHHHNHRIAFATSDLSDTERQLQSALSTLDSHTPTLGLPPVAFTFTGQGAAHKSSSYELFQQSPYFRSQVLHLDSLARGQGFPSFVPAIDGSHAKDELHSPVVTQLALTCIQIALTKYWGSLGVKPTMVIGHSLGEYAALYSAGVLSAADAIHLVGRRARLLEERCTSGSHTMMAVRASLAKIEACISTVPCEYDIACANSPNEFVLAGAAESMDTISVALLSQGYRCLKLDVAFAFHSAQTEPILDDLEDLATRGVLFQAPQIPIISPLLQKVVFDQKSVNARYLRDATRKTVDFSAALAAAYETGTLDDETVFVEIGPHPTTTGFIKNTLPSVELAVPSFHRNEDNWTTLAKSLASLHCAGVKIDWNAFHGPFEKSLRLLDLPTYAWNDKNYWIQYKGDWALTKGNTFYDEEKRQQQAQHSGASYRPGLGTSTTQQTLEENFNANSGIITVQSDLAHPDFRAAAWGHKMNNCGVVTSSIHADIAYTLGQHLYTKLWPGSKEIGIDITNLVVTKGLVAKKRPDSHQLIQISAKVEDIDTNVAYLEWCNVLEDGTTEPFATATLLYSDPSIWLASWRPMTHLVLGRIKELSHLAETGVANRFSRDMAYHLFANNLVDYADKYRGMKSVVLHGYEAFADVELYTGNGGGTWTVPPYFIDSVCHLAGFIMNVSSVTDPVNNFYVTPGWQSMRFVKPLVAGARYQSYVKMIDSGESYLGDVYILQDGAIMGAVGAIQFRKYPRLLLSRFFSAPDDGGASPTVAVKNPNTSTKHGAGILPDPIDLAVGRPKQVAPAKNPSKAPAASDVKFPPKQAQATPVPDKAASAPAVSTNDDTTTAKAINIIANESEIDPAELTDDASFAELGIDSLMSLVIAERFRQQLNISINGSLFLEYPTIGDLRAWLLEYYD